MPTPAHLDHLEQLEEVNRTFLGFLQNRLRAELDCLGLPVGARATVRAAGSAQLDAVAAFPQALFRLELAAQNAGSQAPAAAAADGELHEVCSAILWSARYTSRQSPYQARLLFGFQPQQIQRLRALSVAELQRLAWAPGLLRCAFTDKEWLWHWLLSATQPEARAQLTLVALQPGIERDWPQRRPAHPVA
jgi:hypothetical protein